jgi:uncharacterized protein YfaS (alpha-2-macroglobulin family)
MSFQKTTVYIALLLLLFSCKEKSVEPDNIYKYKSYISYTTTGIISTYDSFNIHFSKSITQWKSGDQLPSEIVSVSPKVEGDLYMKSETSLEFKPKNPLKSDTEYSVSVQLNELFDNVSEEQKTYTFQCKTIKPSFKVSLFNLQSYSKDWQYVEGLVSSADVIQLEDAKKLVKAKLRNKDVKIVWNESYEKSKAFDFRLDSIQRLDQNEEVLISWDGKAIQSDIKDEESISIPGKDNFQVTKIDVINGSQQYISINFSDPLKKGQNFKGLVSVQSVSKPKFVVDGNVLKVFTGKQITGSAFVDVFEGVKSADGYKLKKGFNTTLNFEELKPQVRLVSSGNILPNSNNLKFNFEAVNVKAVDVRVIKIFQDNVMQFLQNNNKLSGQYQMKRVGRRIAKQTIQLIQDESLNTKTWKAYSVDLSKLFKAETGAIYRVEIDFKREYALHNCEDNTPQTNEYEYETDGLTEDEKEELYWDNKLYDYRNYSYRWRDRNNPCKESYYRNKGIAQNLIASNLGVIAKRGNQKNYFFAVTDILTAQPISGAKIGLYNYQQQKFQELTTNSDGIATYDSDKEAFFAIVTKSNNTTYLKLNDGNSLSLSKFDVSGVKTQKGIKGFLYAERGVWRPGDSIHLNFVLNDADNKLPKGHPVKLEVTDPYGKLVHKKVVADHTGQFYDFPFATTSESITGIYRAKISVGGAKFSKNLKVETVKPNRLKIKLDFDQEIFSYGKSLDGKLQLNWLHGAAARNLRAEITAKIVKTTTQFEGYKNYLFNDPTRNYYTEEIQLFNGKVNADGFAKINNPLTAGGNAPGMLRVNFLVKAFETGGDFSIDAFSKKYAPYPSFVGLQSPKEDDYGSYPTKSNHRFDIVTVTDQGKPVARKNVEVKVYKIRWRWWWSSGRDNLSSYNSDTYHQPYKSMRLNTGKDGKANFTLNIPKEDRGRFLIRVIDPVSKHATGRTLYFYDNWWENISSEDKEAAKMLIFNSDKKSYKVGETARITFPSAHVSNALISLENGNEVIEHQWVSTNKGKTSIDIKITPKMTPNFFVNISLLQPHAKVENDLPIRLYGTIPIKVENPAKKLEPVINMANSIEPEKEFEVTISEKSKKPMTYTLAIVEEGLLDLTRFKTPNPYGIFYAREALGVRTWDMFDEVMGAYSGSIDQVFAIGGDGTSSEAKNRKANRFKPVVKHLGPFILKPGENKKHTITLPNYIGAVRTMVVAGNSATEAYGNAEKSVKVKKPLMVLASLPRKLSPGEKVTLPVTVFATEDNIKNVDVTLELTDGIKVNGSSTKQLSFSKTGEQMAYFTLDVDKANGINKVKVTAKSGSHTAKYDVEIDVVNPNPMTSKVISKTLDANGSATIDFSTFGVEGTNSAVLQLSSVPPIDFERRLEYLIRYPHGCVEQTTSSVFPQLYMMDLFDLSASKKNEVEENIKNGIKRLGHFQRPNGGMSYWMGEANANDWGTSYAGHFMIEAEKKGYLLPFSFKSNWVRYQKEVARNWKPKYNTYSGDVNQAYRLYTLALSGNADLGAMNRLREFDGLSNEAKWRLAAAYAIVGQKQASAELSNTATIQFVDRYTRYNYGSVTRNKAMALETMLLLDDERTFEFAKSIAKDLSSSQWMSTQTTAYGLLAMGKLMIKNGGKSIKVDYNFNGKKETLTTSKTLLNRTLDVSEGNYKVQLTNKESNVVYVSIINKGKLPLGKEWEESRGISAQVSYTLPNGTPLNITELQQGQEFVAKVKVKNLTNDNVQDVALTQIFPSGWEIVNTRFTEYGGGTNSKARYTDIRDDRVNFYFDLARKGYRTGEMEFTVLLNASYLGTYYLPGVQAEAMYDNDYLVREKGKWIKVIGNE